MDRYIRFFKNDNVNNKEKIIEENRISLKIKEKENIDFQSNSILMLNQILLEISNVNKKIEELKENIPINQEHLMENKRRINLIRDTNGKIVSADVIDISKDNGQQNKEKIITDVIIQNQ